MNEIKKAGNFLYRYNDNNTVTVAKQAVFSNIAGQMEVNIKMEGVAERTGTFHDVIYDGCLYVGVNFYAIDEELLIEALTR